VRVIAGKAKGRPLKAVPGQSTRPTTDKVKEAIFSMIGPFFDGGLVLDLFAGTGGLGIEAWSRGADKVISIDKEKISIDIIRSNVQAAGAQADFEIYRNDSARALKVLHKKQLAFDIIFLDPPYRMNDMDQWLHTMQELNLIATHAVIVIEHDSKVQYDEVIGNLKQQRHSQYGEAAVTIYRHQPEQLEHASL